MQRWVKDTHHGFHRSGGATTIRGVKLPASLHELWAVDPLKWSKDTKKDWPNGDPASRAGRWLQREWWRKGPAIAVTAGAGAGAAAALVDFGAAVDTAALRLSGTELYADLLEHIGYVPTGAPGPIVADPRMATLGGLAFCAGALALNRYWPKLAERPMGQWWAWWAQRRMERRITATFKQRWDRAMVALGITAALVGFGVDQMGNIRAKAQLAFTDQTAAAGHARDVLEKRATDLAGMLPVDGLGWAEDIEIRDADRDRTAFVEIVLRYKELPPPSMIPPDLGPADRVRLDNGEIHDCVRLGLGHDGWVYWDLDEHAHLNVIGPSGFGKGVSMAAIVNQCVRRGWLALIIDGGGAPEHEVQWGPLIGTAVNYYRFRQTEEIASLLVWVAQLKEVIAYGTMISDLCTKHGVNKWLDLSAEVKLLYPRIVVFMDELTLALAKSGDPKSTPNLLRSQIGGLIETLRRGYRKYGVHSVLVDQITYQGKTHLPPGVLQQASMFMYVGPATRQQYRMMASGVNEWPNYKPGRGRGVAGQTGLAESIKEVVRPNITADHLKRVVAAEKVRWQDLDLAA